MAKERFLTVMTPIKDSDCEATVYADAAALSAAVPPSVENINKIYKLQDGTYMRVWLNPSTTLYEYHAVKDREFPYLGNPLEIFDFTYDANRMGTAPTISAQGVMRYAKSDGSGNDVTLDGLWNQMCYVVFNGKKLHLKQIPTSSKSNEDARYKYDLDFVDERVVLENVYLYDVVSPFITERPISESPKFSFYGDINELAKRINASLIRSGLATLTRKYVPYPETPEYIVPYLNYEQWTIINANPAPLIGTVFSSQDEMMEFYDDIYSALNGDYNRYLMDYIYENENGVYTLTGYQCKIGNDKYGNPTTSEEKLITFENNTIHEALQQFHDTFELEYYITCEKDGSGNFTGNTWIMVADCEHDFADVDPLTDDFVRDDDGIPTTESPFDYGVEDELISKTKTNTTDKIVTRITGVGSTENIPWHYPNPSPDGWIRPVLMRNGVERQNATIDYPTDEGTTVADSVRYEKFLKNRIGISIKKGVITESVFPTSYMYISSNQPRPNQTWPIVVQYVITSTQAMYTAAAEMTLVLDYAEALSGCRSFSAKLYRDCYRNAYGKYVGINEIEEYDSWENYQNPTLFQQMFADREGNVVYGHLSGDFVGSHIYLLEVQYNISYDSIPLVEVYDYAGHHYDAVTLENQNVPEDYIDANGKRHRYSSLTAYVGENFYEQQGLLPYAVWEDVIYPSGNNIVLHVMTPTQSGYSVDGTEEGSVSPMPRHSTSIYMDLVTENLYMCLSDSPNNPTDGYPTDVFLANPTMNARSWVRSFLSMYLRIYNDDGWYIGNDKIQLSDYGLGWPQEGGVTADTNVLDSIEFQRVKWVTPIPNLMPEVFIKTDGERRFYNAHNYYPLQAGTADTAIGEEQVGTDVRNPIYKLEETDPDSEHYEFENEYIQSFPHEHIENFDDVKPTIEGQTNTVDGNVIRIDVVETFEYDATDNDEIWEEIDGVSIQGEYKHPYFFAKLRPLGFNLFDLALQEDMVVSMTTGHCGACNFKIGVDENSKKNPVQLWEYDVYRGDYLNSAELLYEAGTLRRYINLTGLYYDTNGQQSGYKPIQDTEGILEGAVADNNIYSVPVFKSYNYTAEAVENGYVGTMKQAGKLHFEGDVVTNGRFIESQQDTSENYVWVALMKDTETYGVIMPAARPNYNLHQLDVYIRPKSIADVHTEQSTVAEDEENADKFVITNIRLPQVYLRRAERNLSRELVRYMYEHNYQKFNFSIKFSRIYIADNQATDDDLNENSVLYVKYNGLTYRQYVKHYSYKMSHNEPLPEITVDMNEELSVSKTIAQQWDNRTRSNNRMLVSQFNSMVSGTRDRIERNTVKRDSTTILSGNVILQGEGTSIIEMARRGQGEGGDVDAITIEEIDDICV